MCGRAALTNGTLEEIADELDAEPVAPALYRPRYNIAPTDQVWIVVMRGDRKRLIPATWGLPPDATGPGRSRRPLINVRGEAVKGGAFSSLFLEGRCAFVVGGFYEWNATRQPFFFFSSSGSGRPTSGSLLLLGALALSRGPAELPAVTVLTTRPNELVAAVHDRMPVVISPADLGAWLSEPPSGATRLLAPAPNETLASMQVSSRVNSVRNDDPACLLPAADETPVPPKQLHLLG